jgi:hypothetical protein
MALEGLVAYNNENTNKCKLGFNALYFLLIRFYMFRPLWAIFRETFW